MLATVIIYSMDVSELLNTLNDPQRDAVASPLQHQLVLAGAGSGKTRVLVHRIAWLIQVENISPHAILAVTFTNKAAKEMRHRIEALLGMPTQGMWVGTFHGLSHRLLKMHWQLANLPQNFQILDSDDQLRLIKRLLKDLNIDDERYPPKQVQGFINGKKDEGLRAGHISEYGDVYHQTMVAIYAAYEESCQRSGLVDFAELLLRSHELWLNNPDLLSHYQQRFSCILVDEFQDTNTIQYAWLRVLAGQHVKLMAVGDDDQSIYGWRGARIENIQAFEQDFKEVRVTRLEQNYRSTETILGAANALIANNRERLGKELWTEANPGEKIDLYAAYNEQDEATYIVDELQNWIAAGNQRSESAILYRSNAQSRVLEEALIRAQIPYRIYGGQRFYERLEIKNALAYLRLIQNPDDDTAVERVINTPTRGIGNKTLELLRTQARQDNSSLWQAANNCVRLKLLSARASTALQKFLDLILQLQKDTAELPLDELCDHALIASGLIEYHKKEKGEKAQTRVENLEELVSACSVFDADTADDNSELQQFLDSAALDAGEAQAAEFEDSVQLMTLHTAKGLEFPLVFLAGVEENLFPHKMSMNEPGRLEEERRLAYVGITRAMQRLVITYAEHRRLHGSDTYNPPSRFIDEIPQEYIQAVRLKQSFSPIKDSFALGNQAHSEIGFSIGQGVWHEVFGEGLVIAIEGQGASARVQVNFDTDGTKWLVLQYANLRPMA